MELIKQNGIAGVLSAIKAPSNLIQPVCQFEYTIALLILQDISFTGGSIHIVDAPLTMPLSFPDTITKAGLSNLVALFTKGGWLSGEYLNIITLQSDMTV